MVLNARTCKTFHRRLFAGEMETITLLKRNDDQKQGTVRAIKLFQCRKSRVYKTGEPLQGDMNSDHRAVWHIPVVELKRVGVAYLNHLDRIVDKKGRYWETEAGDMIDIKLFETHVDLACQRVDPPAPPGS